MAALLLLLLLLNLLLLPLLLTCGTRPSAQKIIATKLTGNKFVPAGKVSFEAILHKNGMEGRGRALLACEGFRDPRWVAGEFKADTSDDFSFHWTDDKFVIEFHRYNPDKEKPVADERGKAITNAYLYNGKPRKPKKSRD